MRSMRSLPRFATDLCAAACLLVLPGSITLAQQVLDDESLVDVALPPTDEAALVEVVAQSLPGAMQLQQAGARIGRIDIEVIDVFDPRIPEESGRAYRIANALHINTRDSTVRPQLLFRSGDAFSSHVMEETARNLRARRYLQDASVEVIAYHPDSNTVDVLVKVHDNWTLNPGASFGRSGGENSSGIQLDESNLLGLGKGVSVDYVNDVDRTVTKYAYRDPNLLSTRWEMEARYHSASDGGLKQLAVNHPFYSLDTRWSGGVAASHEMRTDRRFEQGVAVDQYRVRADALEARVGWSTGLRLSDTGRGWVQRWSLGWTIDKRRYSPEPVLGTALLPTDRRLTYPWLGLSWFEDHYVVTRNREQIDRTEDLYLGRSFNIRLGYAASSMGSDRNSAILSVSLQDAFQLTDSQAVFVRAGVDGRRESGQWRGAVFSSSARYDWRQAPNALLVVKLDHAHTENPDDSQQLYLGSDEGMRGYPLRYRSGTQRAVLTVEQRGYTHWQILRLLSVGGAAFVDIGRIRGGSSVDASTRRTLHDVGLGLRLGNIRSSRGDVFNLDLAYPLDATGADRKLQFSVTTKSSF